MHIPPPPPQPTPKLLFKPTNNSHNFLLTSISLLLFLTSPKPYLSLPKTTISLNPGNPNPFPTPQTLSNWLKPRIPFDLFSTWGTLPGTKNIHNLWLDCETSLIDSIPPIQNIDIVCVNVTMLRVSSVVLIESHQELSDGTIRKRGRLLSEKMKVGEDVELAVKRAVKEELGCDVVEVLIGSYERKVEERGSVSYPGFRVLATLCIYL